MTTDLGELTRGELLTIAQREGIRVRQSDRRLTLVAAIQSARESRHWWDAISGKSLSHSPSHWAE